MRAGSFDVGSRLQNPSCVAGAGTTTNPLPAARTTTHLPTNRPRPHQLPSQFHELAQQGPQSLAQPRPHQPPSQLLAPFRAEGFGRNACRTDPADGAQQVPYVRLMRKAVLGSSGFCIVGADFGCGPWGHNVPSRTSAGREFVLEHTSFKAGQHDRLRGHRTRLVAWSLVAAGGGH